MTDDREDGTNALATRKTTELMVKPVQTISRGLKDHRQAEEQKARNEIEDLRRELELLEDPESICSFADMCFDGDGVDQDYVAAANWYRVAAEKGHARAQYSLALMYEDGEGVPQDYSEAAKWYRLAAEQGDPGSQNNLGGLYESGLGVAKDYAAAIDWYGRAADGGLDLARENLQKLTAVVEVENYREIVFEFNNLVMAHHPLIGDCALLPHPKARILYATRFVTDDYETKREIATDPVLADKYDRMIQTLNCLFTHLARDWQDIAPEDKDAIVKLSVYESFPDWALPLKDKYIDEERASKEALEATFRVMKDKFERGKRVDRSNSQAPDPGREALDRELDQLTAKFDALVEARFSDNDS